MQNIKLQLVTENGEIRESSDVNFAEIINDVLWKADQWKMKYPWLATIDPYGNTVFNVHQVPLVLKELEQLKNESAAASHTDVIEGAQSFFAKIAQHLYIKLLGD